MYKRHYIKSEGGTGRGIRSTPDTEVSTLALNDDSLK